MAVLPVLALVTWMSSCMSTHSLQFQTNVTNAGSESLDALVAQSNEVNWNPFGWVWGWGGSGKKNAGGPTRQKLYNDEDVGYYGAIKVGGQTLLVVIDTGSFELLVFGSNCTLCGNAKDLYKERNSKTAEIIEFRATHEFGSGTTYSNEGRETMKIGGVTLENQTFWDVYDADMAILMASSFQGIFGVGPPQSAVVFAKMDADEAHAELKDMKKNGDVSKEVEDIVQHYDDLADYMEGVSSVVETMNLSNMSICLGTKSGSHGYWIWNDDALEKSPESFQTVSQYGDYYWSTALGSVQLAGASLDDSNNFTKQMKQLVNKTWELGCADNNCSAIIDTGTSLIVTPSSVAAAVYDMADEWKQAGGTCDDLSLLPDLHFKLNGLDFSLPPEAYMGVVQDWADDWGDDGDWGDDWGEDDWIRRPKRFMPHLYSRRQKKLLSNDTSEMCEPILMTMDVDSQFGDMWILGMPFFRKYYTTFSFQDSGSGPKATSMSFSEQNGKCMPGEALNGTSDQKEDTSVVKSKDSSKLTSAPRRAQMRINAKKVRAPSIARKLNGKKGHVDKSRFKKYKKHLRKGLRPFIHI